MRSVHREALLLAALAFAAYNANLRLISSDDALPTRTLPFSILLDGDVRLDELRPKSGGLGRYPVLVERGGHLYSMYPVTQSLLLTPLYVPAAVYASRAGIDFQRDRRRADSLAKAMEKLCASLLAGASAGLLYLALRELTSRRTALFVALLYAFCTNTWTIASQALWMHGMVEFWLAALLYALLRARDRPRWLALAGLAAGTMVAVRLTGALFAVPALVHVALSHRQHLGRFLLFPLLIAAGLFAYNLCVMGHLLGGYGYAAAASQARFFGSDFPAALLGVLAHPSRGLFVYTPIALPAFWGAARLWRSGGEPALRWLSLGVVAYILLTASYRKWMGGVCFGPRYVTDVLPVLCALLVPVARDLRRRSVAPLFSLAVAWSLVVQVTGAFFYNGEWDRVAFSRPSVRSSVRESQIVMSWQTGPVPPRIGRLRDIGAPSHSEK